MSTKPFVAEQPPAHWAEIVQSVKGFNKRVAGVTGMDAERNGFHVARWLVKLWWTNEWDEATLKTGAHERQHESELLSFGARIIQLWDGAEPQTQGEVMVQKQIRNGQRRGLRR